jgi:hypothetical protein
MRRASIVRQNGQESVFSTFRRRTLFRRIAIAGSTLLVAAAICALPASSFAVVTLGTESNAGGFLGDLVGPIPLITVGSDGESGFDPFAFGADTSDGIKFTDGASWTLAPGVVGWVPVATTDGSAVWVLPANLTAIGCGTENEPTCEPVGMWNFVPGAPWVPGTDPTQIIFSEDGAISDVIHLTNTGPGGSAQVTFASDPIPEPGTLVLVGCGILGMLWCARRGKRA